MRHYFNLVVTDDPSGTRGHRD